MKRAKLISYGLRERPDFEELWELRFAELVEFQKKYGHTRVPARWSGNRSLGRWLAHQRDLLRLEELRRDRAERLDQLGEEWSQVPECYDGKERYFESMLARLAVYRKKFGDAEVSKTHDRKLAEWVSNQRGHRRTGEMSEKRLARLEEVNFPWGAEFRTWDEQLIQLRVYKARFGNTLVPARWSEDAVLGRWVAHQRELFRAGNLPKEKCEVLELLGFQWVVRKPKVRKDKRKVKTVPMGMHIEDLKKYRDRFGDTQVPARWKENMALGRWVAHQRELFRAGKLREERKRMLDDLGFEWVVRKPKVWKEKWMVKLVTESAHVEGLKEYQKRFGDTQVPARWKENKALGRWVAHQRELFRQGRMPDERKRMLDDLGFQWEVIRTQP